MDERVAPTELRFDAVEETFDRSFVANVGGMRLDPTFTLQLRKFGGRFR
jgi:hypothetical protein